MAEPLTINVTQAAKAAPVAYTVPGSAEVEALSAAATFNGAAVTSGPFLACMAFYSAAGLLLARVYPGTPVNAGDSAVVTFAPGLSDQTDVGRSASPFKLISAATTNSTLVNSGTTQLTSYFISNTNAAVRYVKLYDKATAPTVGTDTPAWTLMIPPSSAANVTFDEPLEFLLGLGIGTTVNAADNDSTAVAASEIIVNLGFI